MPWGNVAGYTDGTGYGQPYMYNSSMPSRGSDTYAADMRAYLARQEYADYMSRYAPVEDELIDAVMGREMLDERLSAISVNNQQARQTAEANMALIQGRYGASLNPQQQMQNQTNLNLSQAIATAGAMNQTRTHIFERNMNTLTGAGGLRGQVQAGYGGR